jgi:hypothetical protein
MLFAPNGDTHLPAVPRYAIDVPLLRAFEVDAQLPQDLVHGTRSNTSAISSSKLLLSVHDAPPFRPRWKVALPSSLSDTTIGFMRKGVHGQKNDAAQLFPLVVRRQPRKIIVNT